MHSIVKGGKEEPGGVRDVCGKALGALVGISDVFSKDVGPEAFDGEREYINRQW